MGNWFNPANWSAGVPDSNTTTEINNGGTAQITSGNATAGQVQLGVDAQHSGTLSISGGSLVDDGSFDIGQDGTGALIISNGSVVSSTRFVLASNSASNGTATVSGSGSTWDNLVVCFVGYLGTATLNITNGGEVSGESQASIGESDASNGTVTVDGTGSTWTQFEAITVGGNGAGTLNIANGGVVLTVDSTFGGGVIGRNPGSNGTVNVSGAGSAWMNNGPINVADGFEGTTGSLHVMNGAGVSSSYSVVGGSGGTGTAAVEGQTSIWTNGAQLYVGASGGNGVLTIAQGGRVTDSTGYIGFTGASSIGTVEVDGIGSTWANSGNLYVGGSESGAAGIGMLHLTNGGTANASAVIVWATGTVAGNGFIQTNNGITVQGMLAPDETMSITGNLTFVANAIMLSTVTPKTADNVAVQGAAMLDGQLSVTLTGGPFTVGTQFTVLQATSGLNGTTFSTVSIITPPGVNAQVIYDTNHVYLVIESSGTPTPTPTASPTPTATPSPTARVTATPRPRPSPAVRPTAPPHLTPVPPPPSPRPTAAPRPTPPPHLSPPPSPTSPRPTPAPRP
jgi:T5SS/PEP-CTERM-associated repeat protein